MTTPGLENDNPRATICQQCGEFDYDCRCATPSASPAAFLAEAMALLEAEAPCIRDLADEQLRRYRSIHARNKNKLSGQLASTIFMAELWCEFGKLATEETQTNLKLSAERP